LSSNTNTLLLATESYETDRMLDYSENLELLMDYRMGFPCDDDFTEYELIAMMAGLMIDGLSFCNANLMLFLLILL